MKKILIALVTMFISFSVVADHHNATAATEVRNATNAFNLAYETNDVEGYFNMYAEDAMLYFYGNRWEVSAYYDYWKNSMVGAGGGVEKNTASDIQVMVAPGGNTAVVGFFIENRSRSPDGNINEEKGYETEVWQKIDGAWKIISLHYSVIAPE
tara:strand:+ start:116 stop:577 length:462 start_codon:yes stop_codon:yes gene_type:complete